MIKIQIINNALMVSLMLLLIQACATVQVVQIDRLNEQQFVPGATPVAHIYARNWGIYLFKYIPIITGNLDNPGIPELPVFFRNSVRPDLLVEKITQRSQQLGGTVVTDLRVRDRSHWVKWTLLFWVNEFEGSANTSKPRSP